MKYYVTNNKWKTEGLKMFQVIVIREKGFDQVAEIYLDQAEEHLIIEATDRQEAYEKSLFLSNLPFMGQIRKTIIDGEEHYEESY